MSLFIAAYDISDDRTRSRVARVLGRYGSRVQRSVFEVFLEADDVSELRRDVGSLLAPSDDFSLFPVDERPSRHRIQWQHAPDAWDPVVLL